LWPEGVIGIFSMSACRHHQIVPRQAAMSRKR
jgi:hypothetical protein